MDFNVDWEKATKFTDGQIVPLGQDSEYIAKFYMGRVPNFDMTDFKEVPHLRLEIPGSKLVTYDQPVRMENYGDRPSDPERFPLQWRSFLNGKTQDGRGTPISEWPDLSEGDVRRLQANGVDTVEQLSEISDRNVDGLGFGTRLLREKARMFVMGHSTDPEKDELRAQLQKQGTVLEAILARLGGDSVLELLQGNASPEAPEAPEPRQRRRRGADAAPELEINNAE